MSRSADDRTPQDTPARAADPKREGSSLTTRSESVGAQRFRHSDTSEQAGPQPDAEPIRTPAERDESPADEAPMGATGQPMRRAGPGAPGVIEQAFEDVERGLQDTDLYGSGNLASPDDKGRRPEASIDRADGQDAVRRSGHDVDAG